MNLKQEIIELFDSTGWTQSKAFVRYSAISRAIHLRREKINDETKTRASNIERMVRKLRQEGQLESKLIDGQVCFKKLNGGIR